MVYIFNSLKRNLGRWLLLQHVSKVAALLSYVGNHGGDATYTNGVVVLSQGHSYILESSHVNCSEFLGEVDGVL